jgi:hypothetical protein
VSLKKFQQFQKQRNVNHKCLLSEIEMSEQQKNLEKDIVKINLEICSINESNGMKNIHLDKYYFQNYS